MCFLIKDQWINSDYIVIDGQTPEVMKSRVGLMKKFTGGESSSFGVYAIGEIVTPQTISKKWLRISDWSYKAPAFLRHYICLGENESVAIWIKQRTRKSNYTYKIFSPDGSLYEEGTMNNCNRTGQYACDKLRRYLTDEIIKHDQLKHPEDYSIRVHCPK
jgi:hypothetical protein